MVKKKRRKPEKKSTKQVQLLCDFWSQTSFLLKQKQAIRSSYSSYKAMTGPKMVLRDGMCYVHLPSEGVC